MNKNTKILDAHKEQDIVEAVSLLSKGEIVALPTETVYGLAADAKNVEAVKNIFTVKNRPSNHPLIVHIASFDHLSEWVQEIPPIAAVLAQHFWPGPLTLLLKKHDQVNSVVTGGLKTIAIRVPDNKAFLHILNLLNSGIAAPSANPYKRISPTTAEHVMAGLSGKISAVVDGGPCQVGIESTIVDVTKDVVTILRHGPITKKMIEDVIKAPVASPLVHLEKVPGNVQSHYQPHTKTSLFSLDEIDLLLSQAENKKKKFGLIHYSDFTCTYQNVTVRKLSKDKNIYAQLLYKILHELDVIDADEILIEMPPHEDSWSDIFDRLSKATAINKN